LVHIRDTYAGVFPSKPLLTDPNKPTVNIYISHFKCDASERGYRKHDDDDDDDDDDNNENVYLL